MVLRHGSTSSRLIQVVALGVALAVSAGCSAVIGGTPASADRVDVPGTSPAQTSTSPTPGHQITEPGSATPTGGQEPTSPGGDMPAPFVDPETDSRFQPFYQQSLQWGPCDSFAVTAADRASYANPDISCARLTVPLNYADPAGTTITLAVVRQQARGDRIGSVVFNPGGPGASGVSIVATLAQYGVDPALAQTFDYVGFDPRGVGASEPHVACQTDAEQDANRAANWPGFMPSSTQAEIDAANDRSKQFVADCVDTISQQGVDGTDFLAQLGTANVAKDLDILRAVLGDEKLTYVGWSYGTSIGTHYAEQFPGKVRAMVLDGALDPAIDSATDSLQQTAAFQRAFDTFAGWCVDRDNCPWSAADDAVDWFQHLAQPLMTQPLPLPDGRVVSFADAVIGVASALYSDFSWPSLLSALRDADQGDGAALMALADGYNDRDATGHYSRLLESFTAIRCMDSDRITDPSVVTDLNRQLIAAAPFQDNGQPPAAIFDTCAFWPVPPTTLPHTPNPSGLAPVLVISTTNDPATPYQAGVNLAEDLGGRLLTVEGTRHTAYMLAGMRCVDDIADDYLMNLALPVEGASCS